MAAGLTGGPELASAAASWSTWACAVTSVLSRSFRSAASCPDEIALLAIMSKLPPFGSLTVMVPAPDSAGLLFHCEVAFSVPCELKSSCDAWPPPTSWMPELVNTVA